MKKIVFITFAIALIIVIGVWIYFVTGVSAVYPSIKNYEYSGNINQLVYSMRAYTSTNSNVTFKITDTVDNSKNGYAIYMTIEIKSNKHNIEYGLKCEKNNHGAAAKTIIQLVQAYDKTNNIGGYSKDVKGVKALVDEFDSNILKHLQGN